MTSHSELCFERISSVVKRVAASRSTIYEWISQGRFPAPVKLGDRMVAWDKRAIDRWIEQRIKASRDQEAA